jgi:hypothetical protein
MAAQAAGFETIPTVRSCLVEQTGFATFIPSDFVGYPILAHTWVSSRAPTCYFEQQKWSDLEGAIH